MSKTCVISHVSTCSIRPCCDIYCISSITSLLFLPVPSRCNISSMPPESSMPSSLLPATLNDAGDFH